MADEREGSTTATMPATVPASRQSLRAMAATIEPGATIAGRYLIKRLIAHGGMGDVYEATDLDLRTDIALKTIRGVATGERIERFRREIFLARKVTHPNVCRVFDLGRHTVPDAGDFAFITMELLVGETLADRLKATGKMATRDALPVIRQIAAAVDAAHAVGVVHRDLKPGNVMLVPGSDGTLRALVTDFGVAHASGDPFEDVSNTGEVVGSPAYMAPEQIDGSETTAQVDIYALGIVIYELVTGVRPFQGESSISAVVKRLRTDPPPPTTYVPALSPIWEAAILRCLDRDPRARFASGAEVVEALTAGVTTPVAKLDPMAATEPSGLPIVATPVAARGRAWWLAGAALLAGVALLAGLAFVVVGRDRAPTVIASGITVSAITVDAAPSPPPSAPPAAAATSLAVLPFVDTSPSKDQEYFADGLSEELLVLLSKLPRLRIVGRTSSFQFKNTRDDAATIGRKLGVAKLLEGSVSKVGDRVRITARLISVADGFQVWSESYDRQNTDVFAMQDEIATSVARALAIELTPLGATQAAGPRTTNPEAHNQVLLGRTLFARNTRVDLERAVAAFEKAVALDAAYAAAYAALALAEYRMRDFATSADLGGAAVARALAHSQRAVELGPDVASAHAVRGYLLFNITWDWDAANAEFKRALELDPRDPDTLQRYGQLLDLLGEPELALAVTQRAVDSDPLSASAWTSLAALQIAANNLVDARRSLTRALELDPAAEFTRVRLALLDLVAGNPDAALAQAQPLLRVNKLSLIAMSEHTRGHAAASTRALDELVATERHTGAFQIAEVYAWRGEPDRAFAWLDSALADRDAGLNEVRSDPLLVSLRRDPRYHAFLVKLRLTP